MKCQNCGHNEANFFQHLNINGNVTETGLCAECAEALGYMRRFMAPTPRVFNELFSDMTGAFQPFFGYAPRVTGLRSYPRDPAMAGKREETVPGAVTPPAEPDAELSRRRELNVLREQMKIAALAEDFECAIELREQIKLLESEKT